jgi:hypothetical protein
LDTLLGNLSSVQTFECHLVLVLIALDLLTSDTKNDLDVTGVSLVGVDPAVSAVRSTAGFLDKKSRSEEEEATR